MSHDVPAYPPAYQSAPTSGKATTSLVLGIVSLVMCGFLVGIPAMVLGSQAKKEIRRSEGRVGGEGLATAGFWTGLVGTVWSVLLTILVIVLFVFGAGIARTLGDNCDPVTADDGTKTVECHN